MAPANARTWRDGLGEVWLERRGRAAVRVRRLVVPADVAAVVEADIAAAMSLNHPSVVKVLDVAHCPEGLDLVTEGSTGVPLRKFLTALLDRNEKLAVSHATWIILEVLNVLQAAQARMADGKLAPVVHGRLSPGHIILGQKGEVRIGGWGLDAAARSLLVPTEKLDRTFGYVAPEQKDAAARQESDTFALGAMLAEMVLGEPLYARRTLEETFAAMQSQKPLGLRAKRDEVPLALEEAVGWCLEPNADRRPRAEHFAIRLKAFQGILDVGDRIKSPEHASKLADLLRLRLGKEAMAGEYRTEEVEIVEEMDVATQVRPPPSMSAGGGAGWKRALAAVLALGAAAGVGFVLWPAWGPAMVEKLPPEWQARVGGIMPATSAVATKALPSNAPVPLKKGVVTPVPVPVPVVAVDAGAAAGARELAQFDGGSGPAPAKAHVIIRGPAGGHFLVDGTDVGKGPAQETEVAAGAHLVEWAVTAKAKPKLHERVTVAPGERVTVPLKPHRH